MAVDQVPTFNAGGVIPPFAGDPKSRLNRSPYEVTMGYLVTSFGKTAARVQLLRGLVEYRRALYQGGFLVGFQWLDGSFVENCEVTRGRAPNDIDLVTFFHRPVRFQTDRRLWQSQGPAIQATHFNRQNCRNQYRCDTFPIDLDKSPSTIVEDVAYWFGLFSHQRVTNVWKGMLQLALQTEDSDYANELLLVTQAEASHA